MIRYTYLVNTFNFFVISISQFIEKIVLPGSVIDAGADHGFNIRITWRNKPELVSEAS